jgi:hypothetical protein
MLREMSIDDIEELESFIEEKHPEWYQYAWDYAESNGDQPLDD